MTFTRKIKLAHEDMIVGELNISCSIGKSSVSIDYKDELGREISLDGRDFFYLLAKIRENYAENRVLLLCKGSLRDVFPGGLTSESSFGELAYHFDEFNREKTVINIFDPVTIKDIKLLSNFSKQKEQRKAAIKYFGRR
ncbi:MAG: hypothetical protein HRT38_20655 [Alteromonadaceae bacterium]|nr:hypothetical protein [Alteromonadaceae bacterium]